MNLLVPIVAAVVTVGILILSLRDVTSFRLARVRAIAGVCFTEAIRRRVLWITPLAILGVLAITQLTRPLDAQDAIRQTTRYCVFATGLVVVLTSILLACANLPKEIESRVIFTIITKPTTRLEIVLGKVIGFASVSAVILLIMGVFTVVYLQARSWSLEGQIKATLARTDLPEGMERSRLQRYADQGLLGTKAIRWPDDMQVYAKEPSPDGTRWASGSSQSFIAIPFALSEQEKADILKAVNNGGGPLFSFQFRIDLRRQIGKDEQHELESGNHPLGEQDTFGPAMPTSRPALPIPRISVLARAQRDGKVLGAAEFSGDKPVPAVRDRGWIPGGIRQFMVPITSGAILEEFLNAGRFNLEVTAVTPGIEIGVTQSPASLVVLDIDKEGNRPPTPAVIVPSSDTETVQPARADLAGHRGRPEPPGPRFYSRFGRLGMQVMGRPPEEGDGIVAVYTFRNVGDVGAVDGKVSLQTKISIERAGDLDADKYNASVAEITVRNVKTGYVAPPILIEPDTNRLIDIRVPEAAVQGGSFDVMIRGRTPGQSLGVHGLTATVPSIALVEAEQLFATNLAKGLFMLWLLSTLVIAISVFCSTFLSWPIAVILTVLLLMGRWGVNQLGESLNPGASRGITQDLFRTKDATKTQAVTDSLEALSTVLRTVAPVLPDVDRFPVMEDLNRGVSIPAWTVLRALLELVVYGVPLVLLTYVVLRNKEVAP